MDDETRAQRPGFRKRGSPTTAVAMLTRPLPWTADPWLKWDEGQCGAVLAAIGILRDIIDGDLDPAYWRLRIGHALEALGAAVNP